MFCYRMRYFYVVGILWGLHFINEQVDPLNIAIKVYGGKVI